MICPYCKETIKDGAIICKYCKTDLGSIEIHSNQVIKKKDNKVLIIAFVVIVSIGILLFFTIFNSNKKARIVEGQQKAEEIQRNIVKQEQQVQIQNKIRELEALKADADEAQLQTINDTIKELEALSTASVESRKNTFEERKSESDLDYNDISNWNLVKVNPEKYSGKKVKIDSVFGGINNDKTVSLDIGMENTFEESISERIALLKMYESYTFYGEVFLTPFSGPALKIEKVE